MRLWVLKPKPHGVTRKESERVRGKREEKREEEKEGG
jgi:hypothetical protein